MTTLLNPLLALACAAGVMEALAVRAVNQTPAAGGTAPSATATDYAGIINVANAVSLELDSLLGQGFDTTLASNASPGVTVSAAAMFAVSAANWCSANSKINAMTRAACAFFTGRTTTDTTLADYAGIAAGIKALYVQYVTLCTAGSS